MILKPFEFVYHFVSNLKNYFYDLGWIQTVKIDVPVISVGNISFGGTGKTPCIEFIAQNIQNRKIAIVCRSYKASLKEPRKVNHQLKGAASIFGDEAVLLQSRLSECLVWSGPEKWKTALACLVDRPNLILVDDGFSHRKLQRQFDLVLIDASQFGADYKRESISSLKRAQAVILTKTHLASPEKVFQIQNLLSKRFKHLENLIFESWSETNLNLAMDIPLFVFCGIAQPNSFRKALLQKGHKIHYFQEFLDHQVYSESIQRDLVQKYLKLQESIPNLRMVTTEKDLVKINDQTLMSQLQIARYHMTMKPQDKEILFEKIRQFT